MKHILYFLIAVILQFSTVSCGKKVEKENTKDDFEQNEKMFVSTMQRHLDAVSNRNLSILESTMSPDGKMQLILPGTEIIDGVSGFMEYHKEWFKDSTWTFETKILNTNLRDNFGMAVTEVVYREAARNGEPYFNRMIVSYDLEKIDGKWFIIKDHASSVEKSTDKK